MSASEILANPAEAARRLGVSVKALRLYEAHGLIRPQRNQAGWRFYGAAEMARAQDIVALRALGLSLRDIELVLAGDEARLDRVLAVHQNRLGGEMRLLADRLAALAQMRSGLAAGQVPANGAFAALAGPSIAVALELPWPWAGEAFEIARLPPLTYLTGSLGSGKTRLAKALAAHIPGAVFSGLERVEGDGAMTRERLLKEPELAGRVAAALDWLAADGATESGALLALTVALCDAAPSVVVFDYIEEGLDGPTQAALGAWLRAHADAARPLIVMTRSSAVLDLELARRDSLVIYCPANHAPPVAVLPVAGAAGYEAVADCLGAPEVRTRTAGMKVVIG